MDYTIMDIILSARVLGKCGEGITHTLTGVYVMLLVLIPRVSRHTSLGLQKVNNDPVSSWQSWYQSEDDYIISFDVTFKGYGTGKTRLSRSSSIL